ncbi:hypothetical protein [uncultured Sphingomonas sp.]|uniref:hypothetical protein n=1 Tax=uncultured Sphingomonas sp. TaxID=158754 RepID=UPI0035CAE12D
MKLAFATLPFAALALIATAGADAQTTNRTKVTHDTSVHDGVATRTTRVVYTHKHKTRRARRILGVKVGHKTVTRKTVRETTHSSNGDVSTTVKRMH